MVFVLPQPALKLGGMKRREVSEAFARLVATELDRTGSKQPFHLALISP